MCKMAAIVAFAIASAIALTTPAQARPHHRTHHHAVRSEHVVCGRFGCRQTGSIDTATQREVQGGCPRNLGCGCNLANYFRIVGRKWRELWVARNWAHEGSPAHKGCTGCVAVLSRGRGGHVGVVKAYDADDNPVIYSYANGRLGWTTATYSARRVIAYRQL